MPCGRGWRPRQSSACAGIHKYRRRRRERRQRPRSPGLRWGGAAGPADHAYPATARPTELASARPTELATARPTELATAQATELPTARPTELADRQARQRW